MSPSPIAAEIRRSTIERPASATANAAARSANCTTRVWSLPMIPLSMSDLRIKGFSAVTTASSTTASMKTTRVRR